MSLAFIDVTQVLHFALPLSNHFVLHGMSFLLAAIVLFSLLLVLGTIDLMVCTINDAFECGILVNCSNSRRLIPVKL